ncbi:hypothetical protein G6L37_04590 [Agrobacterium rubi]|nr:hypothetical protein [Agrobacterium rubi]NTF24631.1 hypothetical protein [Agrobacterium rubi]
MTSRKARRVKQSFVVSNHALLRYIERASRIPIDMYWLSLHRKSHASGLTRDPTDLDILEHIERGVSLSKLRKKFMDGLNLGRVIHRTKRADYIAIGWALVALVDPTNDRVMTVISVDMAKKRMPISALKRYRVLAEEPIPTLNEDERIASSGFRYAIRRPGFSPGEIEEALASLAPEVYLVAIKAADEIVAMVRLRSSLEIIRQTVGFTAIPYIADREEFMALEPTGRFIPPRE